MVLASTIAAIFILWRSYHAYDVIIPCFLPQRKLFWMDYVFSKFLPSLFTLKSYSVLYADLFLLKRAIHSPCQFNHVKPKLSTSYMKFQQSPPIFYVTRVISWSVLLLLVNWSSEREKISTKHKDLKSNNALKPWDCCEITLISYGLMKTPGHLKPCK